MTLPPTLVDIGLNLAHDSFDHDRTQVVAACRRRRRTPHGHHRQHARRARGARIEIVRDRPGAIPRDGGRPSAPCARVLRAGRSAAPARAAAAPEVGAAGECGLDYFRNYSLARGSGTGLPLAARTGRGVRASPSSCTSATATTPSSRSSEDYLPPACRRRRSLLHGRRARAPRLPRPGSFDRDHGLDLRRAPRPAPARTRARTFRSTG